MILVPRKRILTSRNAQRGFLTLPGGMGVMASPAVVDPGPDPGGEHFQALLWTGNNTYPRSLALDLDARGGLIWFKKRTSAPGYLLLPNGSGYLSADPNTATQPANNVDSTMTVAEDSISFDTSAAIASTLNTNGVANVLWAMRKKAKFLNVINYTGTGGTTSIAHGLGDVPGAVLIKRLGANEIWVFGHAAMTWEYFISMSTTAAASDNATIFNDTPPDATNLYLGSSSAVNTSGQSYVAYVFGGINDTSDIKCFGYTGNGSTSGPSFDLGWQPRFLMIRRFDSAGLHYMLDTSRTPAFSGNDAALRADDDGAEDSTRNLVELITDGFQIVSDYSFVNASGGSFFVLAVR